MFEGFTRGDANIDGTDIAYVMGGSGPPVLLLHGFPQSRAMWARVAPRLASRYTTVCADLRGYGASAKPKCLPDRSNYAFRAMAADQIGLMRRLGFERFHLVGHDRGGRTGHRMALDHPDAVRTLTVMDIVPTYTMFMETNRQVAGSYWHWYFLSQPEPFPERLIGHDPDFFYETCLAGWGAARISRLSHVRLLWVDGQNGATVRYSSRVAQALRERDRGVVARGAFLYRPVPTTGNRDSRGVSRQARSARLIAEAKAGRKMTFSLGML
jgi:pimeloyl-ACP methyl ester carboxylesterase